MQITMPTITPYNGMFLFGVLMYVLNRLVDIHTGIPVGELFLPIITFFFLAQEGRITKAFQAPGVLLFGLLLLLICASNIANGVSLAPQLRNLFAVFTLFLPIFLFVAVKDKTRLMTYMTGMVVGFALYFAYRTGLGLLEGGLPRTLRGDQITPLVPLAFYLLFRKSLSRSIQWILLGSAALSIYVSFAIEVRAPLTGLVLGVVLAGLTRFLPKPSWVLCLALAAGFTAHFISSFFIASSFDAVISSGSESISNMERAYAIDYCRMVLAQSPWFGGSPQGYAISFSDSFAYVAGFAEEGDNIASPHNSFLEYAVFFGYPAGFAFLLLVIRMFTAGVTGSNLARTIFAAFVCAGLIRIGAFYGFSGWLRVEWFALMFALYYGYQQGLPAAAPAVENLPDKEQRKAPQQRRVPQQKAR